MNFDWVKGRPAEGVCPVCDNRTATHVLDVESAGHHHEFVRCRQCESVYPLVFSDVGDLGGYQIGRADHDMGLKHYVEIGAGIDSLLEPLLAVTDTPAGSLLDVGCGFGFLVSAWDRYSQDSSAHGIELASYGHYGRELLDAPISHALLSENDQARVMKYDFVWSGEVIEHVPDPVQFVADLRSVLKPGGILVLSTPDAASVSPETPPTDLAAVLSLNAHRFIMSESALRDLLLRAGFAHVESGLRGTSLVIWASQLPIKKIGNSAERARALTNSYLETLTKSENGWLRGGALYRAFREAVNANELASARKWDAMLAAHIEAEIGPRHTWRDFIASMVSKSLSDVEFIAAAPIYLGPYLYYRSILELNDFADYPAAIQALNMSLELNTCAATEHTMISQEAARLLASSVFHRLLATSYCAMGGQQYRDIARRFDPIGSQFFDKRYKSISWPK